MGLWEYKINILTKNLFKYQYNKNSRYILKANRVIILHKIHRKAKMLFNDKNPISLGIKFDSTCSVGILIWNRQQWLDSSLVPKSIVWSCLHHILSLCLSDSLCIVYAQISKTQSIPIKLGRMPWTRLFVPIAKPYKLNFQLKILWRESSGFWLGKIQASTNSILAIWLAISCSNIIYRNYQTANTLNCPSVSAAVCEHLIKKVSTQLLIQRIPPYK